MDDLHRRRIELQSPADFTYLLTNIRASAQQKIDAAYPNSAAPQQGEDALKSKVEELVQAVRLTSSNVHSRHGGTHIELVRR